MHGASRVVWTRRAQRNENRPESRDAAEIPQNDLSILVMEHAAELPQQTIARASK